MNTAVLPRNPAPDGDPAPLRRLRRIALVAVIIALVPTMLSYVTAMLGPSNTGLGVRSVEWLRDHGAAGLVSGIENTYYSLTAPSKGGAALRALPHVGYGLGTSAAARATRGRVRMVVHASYRPPNIIPLIHPALFGEGVWRATRPGLAAHPPVLITTFRPDPAYPRFVAGVAWFDHHRTTLSLNIGRVEPSVNVPRGLMEVPPSYRSRLVATFNSAFKLSDSHGGFAFDGHTYAPMQNGDATIVKYRGGRVDVLDWRDGPQAPASIVFARQNLPLIVNAGRPNPNLGDGPEWGATLGNAIRVWRSGVGVDAHGNLLYAAADEQTVGSLAAILIHAGAVRAMELDINSYWVSFISYGALDAGQPANLLPTMVRSPERYLTPEDRDFFAVYAR